MGTRGVLLWFALIFTAACAMPALAAAPEGPDSVRRIAEAGAVELAAARIEALQPRDPAAPQWAEWESLRCEMLGRLGRHQAVLERANRLPAGRLAAPLHACLVEAARSALARGEPGPARVHAARLMWQTHAAGAEIKAVRLTVVESYVAERRGEDAFRSMLRFQQDYSPLERAVANRFAEALLDLGLDREALNWLGATDEAGPARLRLQLRGGTLGSEAVIAQARAALARNPDPAYWRAIHEAAVRARNASLQVEALERLLQSADPRDGRALSGAAQRLWQAYVATAGEIGNKEQLLAGDDGAWADFAARRLGSDAFASRAFFAYLVQRAGNPESRRNAQLQLVFSLQSAGLDYTALRLMQASGAAVETLDPQTRYLLGAIAAKRNDAPLALKLWSGLPTPANANALEWQLTLARTALNAGDAGASLATISRMVAGQTAVSAEFVQSVLELAHEALDARKLDAAQALYALAAPVANDGGAREALFGLGRVHELKGEALAAADAYLRSALRVPAAVGDARALQARMRAASSLVRAGLKDDARAQFEWLVRHAKDPALVAAARRGLDRL